MSYASSMRDNPRHPETTLLEQRNGAGKSRMCQIVGTIDAGIVLVTETTLSLGVDQNTKIKQE